MRRREQNRSPGVSRQSGALNGELENFSGTAYSRRHGLFHGRVPRRRSSKSHGDGKDEICKVDPAAIRPSITTWVLRKNTPDRTLPAHHFKHGAVDTRAAWFNSECEDPTSFGNGRG